MTDVLPSPPHDHTRWSIVTLAEHLAVTPSVVDALVADPETEDGDSPDFHSARPDHTYQDADREWLGDVWLTDEAASRIAAELPAAAIARAVVAADMPTLSGPALLALAEHVLTHGGQA